MFFLFYLAIIFEKLTGIIDLRKSESSATVKHRLVPVQEFFFLVLVHNDISM